MACTVLVRAFDITPHYRMFAHWFGALPSRITQAIDVAYASGQAVRLSLLCAVGSKGPGVSPLEGGSRGRVFTRIPTGRGLSVFGPPLDPLALSMGVPKKIQSK